MTIQPTTNRVVIELEKALEELGYDRPFTYSVKKMPRKTFPIHRLMLDAIEEINKLQQQLDRIQNPWL